MMLFRLFLASLILVVGVYTAVVIQAEGIWALFPAFLQAMTELSWQGQFNLDFLCFLLLSGLWVAWRNRFSPRGNLLAVGAVFLGAPYLAIYLLYLSSVCKEDIKLMLVGDR